MQYAKTIEELQLDGGIPCLDLVNAAVDVDENITVERIHNYNDLLTLALRSGLLDKVAIKELARLADKHPDRASAVMDKMRPIRKDMYLLFSAVASGRLKHLDPVILERFNKAVSWSAGARDFTISKQGIINDWNKEAAGLSLPLRAFIFSANDLLLHHDHSLIRKCDGCAWLFLDTSKSHRRKWCDMQTCGSMYKSRRYYRKKSQED